MTIILYPYLAHVVLRRSIKISKWKSLALRGYAMVTVSMSRFLTSNDLRYFPPPFTMMYVVFHKDKIMQHCKRLPNWHAILLLSGTTSDVAKESAPDSNIAKEFQIILFIITITITITICKSSGNLVIVMAMIVVIVIVILILILILILYIIIIIIIIIIMIIIIIIIIIILIIIIIIMFLLLFCLL